MSGETKKVKPAPKAETKETTLAPPFQQASNALFSVGNVQIQGQNVRITLGQQQQPQPQAQAQAQAQSQPQPSSLSVSIVNFSPHYCIEMPAESSVMTLKQHLHQAKGFDPAKTVIVDPDTRHKVLSSEKIKNGSKFFAVSLKENSRFVQRYTPITDSEAVPLNTIPFKLPHFQYPSGVVLNDLKKMIFLDTNAIVYLCFNGLGEHLKTVNEEAQAWLNTKDTGVLITETVGDEFLRLAYVKFGARHLSLESLQTTGLGLLPANKLILVRSTVPKPVKHLLFEEYIRASKKIDDYKPKSPSMEAKEAAESSLSKDRNDCSIFIEASFAHGVRVGMPPASLLTSNMAFLEERLKFVSVFERFGMRTPMHLLRPWEVLPGKVFPIAKKVSGCKDGPSCNNQDLCLLDHTKGAYRLMMQLEAIAVQYVTHSGAEIIELDSDGGRDASGCWYPRSSIIQLGADDAGVAQDSDSAAPLEYVTTASGFGCIAQIAKSPKQS